MPEPGIRPYDCVDDVLASQACEECMSISLCSFAESNQFVNPPVIFEGNSERFKKGMYHGLVLHAKRPRW
jgi:hypothetical protein